MVISHPTELNESWIEGRPELRWRSTVGTSPPDAAASGTSLLEVDPGHALPRHTDSAEETVAVHPDGEQEQQTIG